MLAGMETRDICPVCDQRLTDAANAMRRHGALTTRAITLVRSGGPTEEQREQFRTDLTATFWDAQSAWDAYRGHLIEHGYPLNKR
jgi:hypothetical protein